jgi:hypothetical protein
MVRRAAGLLRARLPELDLEGVADPRAREGRWSLAQILRATLVGLMAGCRSLFEAERLTEALSPATRRLLGLPRRLADTTARDALCRVPLDGLRAVLHRAVRAARRRKALEPAGLPTSVVALDGKATALPATPIGGRKPRDRQTDRACPGARGVSGCRTRVLHVRSA